MVTHNSKNDLPLVTNLTEKIETKPKCHYSKKIIFFQEDISLRGYQKHVISAEAPGPMSREELEREEVRAQANVEIGVDTKHQAVSGLAFPMTSACKEAMKNYKNEKTNYIQMSINISKEIIDVTDTKSCDIQSLPSRVPEDAPRYHVFRFDHTHEGDFMKSTSKFGTRMNM